MPRRSRHHTGRHVFHVLNRAVQGVTLFDGRDDYRHFLRTLVEAQGHVRMRVIAFAVMPNHWHLVLWPDADGSLAAFMQRLTGRHAQQWRHWHGSTGRGAVYQGRYKAIAVQHDRHLWQLVRYVERNPLRANLVAHAEDWPWTSAAGRHDPIWPVLTHSPLPRPPEWLRLLNEPESQATLDRLRASVQHSRHFGTPSWQARTVRCLAWRQGLRSRGRTRVDLPPDDAAQ